MILQANPVSELLINVVRNGDLTTLQKLIDLGASTDVSDVSRDPLLFVPIVEGNDEILASLLTRGLFDFCYFLIFHLPIKRDFQITHKIILFQLAIYC